MVFGCRPLHSTNSTLHLRCRMYVSVISRRGFREPEFNIIGLETNRNLEFFVFLKILSFSNELKCTKYRGFASMYNRSGSFRVVAFRNSNTLFFKSFIIFT